MTSLPYTTAKKIKASVHLFVYKGPYTAMLILPISGNLRKQLNTVSVR